MDQIWAIIPVKSLAKSKSRLATVLSPAQRADLTRMLLRRTLRLLQASGTVAGSIVVSPDGQVRAIARELGAGTATEKLHEGLNAAVAVGVCAAKAQRAQFCLVLPSDLPYLCGGDISTLCAPFRQGVGDLGLLAGDSVQQGTNALLLPARVDFGFQYGRSSFQAHHAEIIRRGLTPVVVQTPGLQFDLDTIADWQMYQAHPTLFASTQSA